MRTLGSLAGRGARRARQNEFLFDPHRRLALPHPERRRSRCVDRRLRQSGDDGHGDGDLDAGVSAWGAAAQVWLPRGTAS
jgi:hypothetical protein